MATAAEAGAEGRFLVSHLGLLVVGIGSFCFHGSLLYEFQLLDELPMLYTTAVFIYCITLQDPRRRHSPALAAFLAVLCTAVTIVYVMWQEPAFHQACYGAMVVFLTGNCLRIAYRDRATEPERTSFIVQAVVLFLVAWGLWNIDIHYCVQLKDLRAQMGWAAPLLELHGWWHILTAYSSYLQVLFSSHVQMRTCGKPCTLRYALPFGLLPYIASGATAQPTQAKWTITGDSTGSPKAKMG